jgi:dTDP-4-amino-4,6-dideoxygalactose transaminase
MWSYKDHGKSWDAVYEREHPAGFRWLSERVGTNWRLTEMQSAIGRVQIGKLSDWSRRRRENAAQLTRRFSQHPMLRVAEPPGHIEHAYYRWYAYVRPETLRPDWSRARITDRVAELGVWCQGGSCGEIYLEKAFEGTGFRPERRLPGAQQLGETSLSMRTDPVLYPEHIDQMADVLEMVLAEAKR